MKRFLQSVFLLWATSAYTSSPINIIVISPSYNNAQWCRKNIESVANQNYPHWKMIIVDDCSTDNTFQLLNAYIKEHKLTEKVSLRRNTKRQGALYNWYHTIHSCPNNAVIVSLDGDDWLAHKNVLARIAQEYANHDCWLTYGQFINEPNKTRGTAHPFPHRIHAQRAYRDYPWHTMAPRTFYAWLFKKIKRADLEYKGQFFDITCDLAYMFPMLEMASQGHIRYIPDILYVYNRLNPISDIKINREKQLTMETYIRKKKRYKPL